MNVHVPRVIRAAGSTQRLGAGHGACPAADGLQHLTRPFSVLFIPALAGYTTDAGV
jgi:hypothetical protein